MDQDNPRTALPATEAQKAYLLSYMEKRPSFAQGEFDQPEGKVAYEREWGRLKESLNNVPRGAMKSTHQWKTYWKDQRQAVKKRAQAAVLANTRGTGGGPPPPAHQLLTQYDNRILQCMGGWKRVIGITSVKDPLEINRPHHRSRSHRTSPAAYGKSSRRSRSRSYRRSPAVSSRDYRRDQRSSSRTDQGHGRSSRRSRSRSFRKSLSRTDQDRGRSSRRSRSRSYRRSPAASSRDNRRDQRSSSSIDQGSGRSLRRSRSRSHRTPAMPSAGVEDVWEKVPEDLLVPRNVDENGWEIPSADVTEPKPSSSAPKQYSAQDNKNFLDKLKKLNSSYKKVSPQKTKPESKQISAQGNENFVDKLKTLNLSYKRVSPQKTSMAVASSGGGNAVSSLVQAPAPMVKPNKFIILKLPQSEVQSFLKGQHSDVKIIRRPSLSAAGIGGIHVALPLKDISNTVQK